MSKLITVVLPTSNRGEILSESIPLFDEQVSRNKEFVEFVVCDNASTDDTVARLREMQRKYDWLSLVHYDEREEDIGASIARSAENAHGDYILFWGDDDIPGPAMLDVLLSAVRRFPEVACIMMNRVQARQKEFLPFMPATDLQMLGKHYPGLYTEYDTAQDFIYANAAEYGFLGAYLIRRSAWLEGMKWYDASCFGYQFQVPLFCGLKDKQCIRINYPMLIQRLFNSPRYAENWPLYCYVGLPRVYKIVQKAGVIDNWRIPVRSFRYPASTSAFVFEMLGMWRRNWLLYRPYAQEIAANQDSWIRMAVAMSVGVLAFCKPLLFLIDRIHIVLRILLRPLLQLIVGYGRVLVFFVRRLFRHN